MALSQMISNSSAVYVSKRKLLASVTTSILRSFEQACLIGEKKEDICIRGEEVSVRYRRMQSIIKSSACGLNQESSANK